MAHELIKGKFLHDTLLHLLDSWHITILSINICKVTNCQSYIYIYIYIYAKEMMVPAPKQINYTIEITNWHSSVPWNIPVRDTLCSIIFAKKNKMTKPWLIICNKFTYTLVSPICFRMQANRKVQQEKLVIEKIHYLYDLVANQHFQLRLEEQLKDQFHHQASPSLRCSSKGRSSELQIQPILQRRLLGYAN